MSIFDEADEPDRPLTDPEDTLASRLTAEDLEAIDEALLERAEQRWRKVAFVVAHALSKLHTRFPGIPDVYYGQRVRRLVETGALESQGNLERMRFSEVRLPERR
jgi:hypothetical protein